MEKTNSKDRIRFLLSVIFFLAAFVSLCLFIRGHLILSTNSDDSSELILSKLLSEEKKLLTDKWYYSTELRVVNNQVLYAFFFLFSDNWNLVRILSNISAYILMFLALFFMMDRLKLRKHFFLVAGILCIPFSSGYYEFILKGAYYIPHIIITFLAIGLTEWIIDSHEKRPKMIALLTISFLLALIAGLNGARLVVMTYAPLLLTAFFVSVKEIFPGEKEGSGKRSLSGRTKAFLIASVVPFAGCVIGYIINSKILVKHYSFRVYNISFSGFTISRLSRIISGFLNSMGFSDRYFFSNALIFNIICFAFLALTVIALIYGLRKTEDTRLIRFTGFCLSSILAFSLLYTFSDMPYYDRYNLPIIVLFIPLGAFALNGCPIEKKTKEKILVSAAVILLLRGGLFYLEEHKTDKTGELRAISSELIKGDYRNGYATFWNANVLTELSDGEIEVWDWDDTTTDITSVDQTYQWLQLISHVTEHPQGKVFWVLTDKECDTFDMEKNVSSEHIIYESPEDLNWDVFEEEDIRDSYKVYGFTGYDEMFYIAGRYSYNKALPIEPGKTGEAPETTLYPDTYTLICTGSNLGSVDVSLRYKKTVDYLGNSKVWDRLFDVEPLTVKQGDDYLILKFTLDEIATDIRPVFTNKSDKSSKITSIELYKDYIYYADFWGNTWINNGYDDEGSRHLNPDGESFGPYITLAPGTYAVEFTGKDLDLADYDFVFNDGDGLEKIEPDNILITNEKVSFTVTVNKTHRKCEIRCFNTSDKDMTIDRLTMVMAG